MVLDSFKRILQERKDFVVTLFKNADTDHSGKVRWGEYEYEYGKVRWGEYEYGNSTQRISPPSENLSYWEYEYTWGGVCVVYPLSSEEANT